METSEIASGASDAQLGLINSLSVKTGVQPEALRLVLTLLAGYPAAAIYSLTLAENQVKALHHIYFAGSGLLLCYFNYGFDTYHSLLAILVSYLLMLTLRQAPKVYLTLNFLFHMGYLMIGYYFTSSADYDILWTMPHCILVLRMIGFGFDIADGGKSDDQLSKDQKDTAIKEVPTLLELMAFAYFPSSFLVGPQFPYRRYQKFTNGEFRQYSGNVKEGIKRLSVGVLYLGISQLGLTFLPNEYFLSDDFRNEFYVRRLIYLGFWGKFTLYKYISCWLLTEGALMCFGFTYNGNTADGEADWSGCTNVKLMLLETGNTMEHYVRSFNVNTNHWVAQYIYKRLKFMNNRNISYAAALGFLAVWHGFHSGYYMTFLMEFLIVTVEKQVISFYSKAVEPNYGESLKSNIPYQALQFIALKSYNLIYMGWCLIAFVFLKYDRWLKVMSAVHYFGFIYMLIWTAIFQTYKYYLRSARRAEEERTFSRATELSPTAGNRTKED